jgi:hypothetical protein
MDVTINLKPELTPGLTARAQAEGLTLEQFLSRKVETFIEISSLPALESTLSPDHPDQWEKGLDAWLDSFPQHPVLSEEALKRENWYSDRW